MIFFRDVLPKVLNVLKDLSKESYLKDRGASYRYTQAYKLQLNVLQQIARVIIDLEVADNHIETTMDVTYLYLNKKQPLPLQVKNVSHTFQQLLIFLF